MLNVDGRLISVWSIVSAEIDSTHYMLGPSRHVLILHLVDGTVIRAEHDPPIFDAFATLDRIKEHG